MIPKIIHFVWFGPEMPHWAARNIEEFRRLNPAYEIRLHGEDVLLPAYADTYSRLEHAGEKCDLLRYSLLERYGGWYSDVDSFPFRGLAEAEHAWQLDGSRLFMSEHGVPGRWNAISGATLACSANWHGWPVLRQMVLDTPHQKWGDLGPSLMTRFAAAQPQLVEVARPGGAWFYGPDSQWAGKIYRAVLAGNLGPIRRWMSETGGQLPWAMHLWAHKHSGSIECSPSRAISTRGSGTPRGDAGTRLAAVIGTPGNFAGTQCHLDAMAEGLAACGYRVESMPITPDALSHCSDIPEVVVVWNGLRPVEQAIIAQAGKLGAVTLRLENGFWARDKYVQCDHAGFLHRSSWAKALNAPAPPEGAERLLRFYPEGIKPTHGRRPGYILVLGQVPNDTQMLDSAIQGPIPLQRAVQKALPAGIKTYFRPHPLCPVPRNKIILPLLDESRQMDEHANYLKSKGGLNLQAALEGAAFVVLINSTAGNEALASGVPVLAFGPALYTIAGVARQATIQTIRADIQAMVDGWAPAQEQVENYLQWLACHQYTDAELRQPEFVRPLLAEAGLPACACPHADGPAVARASQRSAASQSSTRATAGAIV